MLQHLHGASARTRSEPHAAPNLQPSSPTSLAALHNSFPTTLISLLVTKDEVETLPLGQELSMAAPGRTISTLHLLSILQNLRQDFARTHNSYFLEFLLLFDTPPFSAILPFPAQHHFALLTFHCFLLSSLPPKREDPSPQPHVG